jgi:hypothetical protein
MRRVFVILTVYNTSTGRLDSQSIHVDVTPGTRHADLLDRAIGYVTGLPPERRSHIVIHHYSVLPEVIA